MAGVIFQWNVLVAKSVDFWTTSIRAPLDSRWKLAECFKSTSELNSMKFDCLAFQLSKFDFSLVGRLFDSILTLNQCPKWFPKL